MKRIERIKILLILFIVSLLSGIDVGAWEKTYEDIIRYYAPCWVDDTTIGFLKEVDNTRIDRDYPWWVKMLTISDGGMVTLKDDFYLCTMKIDGSQKREVVKIKTKWKGKKENLYPGYISWSKDEKFVLISLGSRPSTGKVENGFILINIETQEQKLLSQTGQYANFSPDCKQIVYVEHEMKIKKEVYPGGAKAEKIYYTPLGIWTMATDGANKIQLTDNPGDSHPLWSPDGTMVAFYRARDKMPSDLLVLDIDAKESKVIGAKIFEGWDNVDNKLWISLESKWSTAKKKYLKKMIKIDVDSTIIEEKNDIEALRGIFSPNMRYVIGGYRDEQWFISDFNYDIQYLVKKYQILDYGRKNRKQKNNIWIKE